MKMKHKILILILSVIILSGCLESRVSVVINRDFSGEVEINYSVSGESEYVSSDLSTMKYQFIPIDENSIRQITDRDDGLILKKYERTDRGIETSIIISAGFSSLDKIEKLSKIDGDAALLRISLPSEGNIRVAIRNPFSEETSDQTAALLEALYEDKILDFKIKVPGFLTSTNIGELTNDPAEAELRLTFKQLVESTSDIIWDLKYTSR